jgi:hypothetical protein
MFTKHAETTITTGTNLQAAGSNSLRVAGIGTTTSLKTNVTKSTASGQRNTQTARPSNAGVKLFNQGIINPPTK